MKKIIIFITISAASWIGGYIHKGLESSNQNNTHVEQTTASTRSNHNQHSSSILGTTQNVDEVASLLANLDPEDQKNLGDYYLRKIKFDALSPKERRKVSQPLFSTNLRSKILKLPKLQPKIILTHASKWT